jgi:outer membrane protein TolC
LESVSLSFDALEVLPSDLPPAEVRRQALVHREDLLAALATYQTSQATLQQAIAGQYPDIQIGPGYEFDQSENKWSIGLSVSLPVFNQNQGAIATAEAHRQEAAAAFRALQARILNGIEQAVASYRASLAKLKSAQTIAKQLAEAADRIDKIYEVGEVTASERIAAQLELNNARIARSMRV